MQDATKEQIEKLADVCAICYQVNIRLFNIYPFRFNLFSFKIIIFPFKIVFLQIPPNLPVIFQTFLLPYSQPHPSSQKLKNMNP